LPKPSLNRAEHAPHLRRARNISPQRNRVCPANLDFFDGRLRFGSRMVVVHDHAGARTAECQCNFAPNAPAGAGDQGNLSRKSALLILIRHHFLKNAWDDYLWHPQLRESRKTNCFICP
jgi:hypothetical protein